MANTRQSAKRARQAERRQERNQIIRAATRTAVKGALEAVVKKDLNAAKEGYRKAIRALDKAASKGAIPKGRASRKMSRITFFARKLLPELFQSSSK